MVEAFRDGHRLSADRVTVLERVARSRSEAFGAVVELLSSWMIFRDPPEHTRLRTPVRSAFTPRRVDRLGPTIETIVDEAIDTMLARRQGSVTDFTAHVAGPVPALVIGALLGVDPIDRVRLQAWSDQLATIVFSLAPSSTPPSCRGAGGPRLP